MPHTCNMCSPTCPCSQETQIEQLTKPPPKPRKKSLQQLFAGLPKKAPKKKPAKK